jgi:hypothetical protein
MGSGIYVRLLGGMGSAYTTQKPNQWWTTNELS